jgi:antitoxin ParD1/3/4
VQSWHAAIKKGDDELDRGEGIPYTPQALNDITVAATSSMHGSTRMDPDVLP